MKITLKGRIVAAIAFTAVAVAQIVNLTTSPAEGPDRFCPLPTVQECTEVYSLID